jgi:hypothetical protein
VGNLITCSHQQILHADKKLNKETSELHTTDQMYLVDIYRTCHQTAPEFTLFLANHRIFSKMDHILGYEARLYKYKNGNKLFIL